MKIIENTVFNQNNKLDSMDIRLVNTEEKVYKHSQDILNLQINKADNDEFKNNVKKVNKVLSDQAHRMEQLHAHCSALDIYCDKYQPSRMHAMITSHLDACLHGESRVEHNNYDDFTCK